MKSFQPAYQITKTKDGILACYDPNRTESFYIGGNPRSTISSLPYFIMEIALILFTNRICLLVLKMCRQPPFVAYFVSGALLGAGGLGHTTFFQTRIFPFQIMEFLETMGNLAITFYMFLVGLEIDFHPFTEQGKKTYIIVLSGIFFPFCIGIGLFFFSFDPDKTDFKGSVFWAIALTATNFSEVTRVLVDLKILRKDIGKLAFSTSIISDSFTLALFILSLTLLHAGSYFALLSTSAFILVSITIFRPIIGTIISYYCEESNISERQIWFILGWVMLFGLITDACGSNSIVGSFIFGAIIPRGDAIRFKLMETLDEFITEIMMPMFFLIVGQRFEIRSIITSHSWTAFMVILVLSFLAKIVSTMVVCLCCDMTLQDSTALGLIMNTKGVFALIIINAGRDFQVLDSQTFPTIAFVILAMTCLVEPLIPNVYKRKRLGKYKQRTIQSTSETKHMQFKILVCIYSSRDVSSMISLLEATNASREYPIFVVAFHLVEFIGRTTTMLVMHNDFQSKVKQIGINNKTDQIMDAFELYQQRCHGAFVQPITSVSPWDTMHKDICNLANERQITFLIIPFHTELIIDGKIEDPNSPFVGISQYVLGNAPCSVGLLIDRGLHSIVHMESEANQQILGISMIFIGGPDDREALTYAVRMASHVSVKLNVLRFLWCKDDRITSKQNSLEYDPSEERIDNECINELLSTPYDKENPISYKEKVVENGDETLAAIKDNDHEYDLYVVGRGGNRPSAITAGISEWERCSELGALGDFLVNCNFTSRTSILVVQQYTNNISKVYSSTRLHNNSLAPSQHSSSNGTPFL